MHSSTLKLCRKSAAVLVLTVFLTHPLAPWLQAEQFQNVGMLVAGAEKAREVDVVFLLDEHQLSVLSKEALSQLKSFSYKEIVTAEYSYSKQPRWKSAGVAAVAIGVFAMPLFFLKGKKHWLTIRTAKDYAVLHLDKNDYRLILTAFETRSGKKVEILPEEK